MNNTTNLRERLGEMKELAAKLQRCVDVTLATLDYTPQQGKPPSPNLRKRVEYCVWEKWDTLKDRKLFTVRDVQACIEDPYCRRRTPASFNVVLAGWVKDGFLQIVQQGRGPRLTTYRIPT